MSRHVDLRYEGQSYELTVPLPAGGRRRAGADRRRSSASTSARTATRCPATRSSWSTCGSPPGCGRPWSAHPAGRRPAAPGDGAARDAYFGTAHGVARRRPCIGRADLTDRPRPGPLLVDEYDATTLVPPGAAAATRPGRQHRRHHGRRAMTPPRSDHAGAGQERAGRDRRRDGDRDDARRVLDQPQDRDGHVLRAVRRRRPAHRAGADPAAAPGLHTGRDRPRPDRSTRGASSRATSSCSTTRSEGGTHLPDFYVFKPIFVGDLLVGWSVTIGHQMDVGGKTPGGNGCDATEIYQEGLRIPPLKLFARG